MFCGSSGTPFPGSPRALFAQPHALQEMMTSHSPGDGRGEPLKMKESFQMHLKEPHLLLGFTFRLSTLFCTFVIH